MATGVVQHVCVCGLNRAAWDPAIAASSVIVPNTGTIIRVVSTSAHDGFMQVHVDRVK